MKKPEEITVNLNINVQGGSVRSGCQTAGSALATSPKTTGTINVAPCRVENSNPIEVKLKLFGTVGPLPGYEENDSPRVFVAWFRGGLLPDPLPEYPETVVSTNPASGQFVEATYLSKTNATSAIDWSKTIDIGTGDCPDFEYAVIVYVRHESLTRVRWVPYTLAGQRRDCDELPNCVSPTSLKMNQ